MLFLNQGTKFINVDSLKIFSHLLISFAARSVKFYYVQNMFFQEGKNFPTATNLILNVWNVSNNCPHTQTNIILLYVKLQKLFFCCTVFYGSKTYQKNLFRSIKKNLSCVG